MSLIPDTPLARRVAPSPNHGARRAGPLDMLVLHYTGMDSGAAALARVRLPEGTRDKLVALDTL